MVFFLLHLMRSALMSHQLRMLDMPWERQFLNLEAQASPVRLPGIADSLPCTTRCNWSQGAVGTETWYMTGYKIKRNQVTESGHLQQLGVEAPCDTHPLWLQLRTYLMLQLPPDAHIRDREFANKLAASAAFPDCVKLQAVINSAASTASRKTR